MFKNKLHHLLTVFETKKKTYHISIIDIFKTVTCLVATYYVIQKYHKIWDIIIHIKPQVIPNKYYYCYRIMF